MESNFGIKAWSVAFAFFWGIFFVAVPQASAGDLKCGELLKKKCQECHSLVQTCEELGRGKGSWEESIAVMAAYASTITVKDQKDLVKCLSKQDKKIVELCSQ